MMNLPQICTALFRKGMCSSWLWFLANLHAAIRVTSTVHLYEKPISTYPSPGSVAIGALSEHVPPDCSLFLQVLRAI